MSLETQSSTKTDQVEIDDIDGFFPGLVVEKPKGTRSIFDKKETEVDLNSLTLVKEEEAIKRTPTPSPKSDILDALDEELIVTESTELKEAKDLSTSELKDFIKSRIESGQLSAFSDFDETKTNLDDYLKGFKRKDFEELLDVNDAAKKKELEEAVPKEFFKALPSEMQRAAEYFMNGGRDLKGMFASLAAIEEVKGLDVKKDAEQINRIYLESTGLSEDEVQEQLDEWKDMNLQEAKSARNHPKLIKAEEEKAEERVQKQLQLKKFQEDQVNFYTQSVIAALQDKDLEGIQIDKATQELIYQGLTRPDYKNRSGRPVTKFDYEIENLMFGEKPNYKKLAKIMWILENEKAYEEKISTKANNKQTEDQVRKIKTEAARNTKPSQEAEDTDKPIRRTLPKPTGRIFSR